MKNINLLFFSLLAFIVISFSNCNKEICTECTESGTGVSDSFCGTKSEVDSYEDTLNELGEPLGQTWVCER